MSLQVNFACWDTFRLVLSLLWFLSFRFSSSNKWWGSLYTFCILFSLGEKALDSCFTLLVGSYCVQSTSYCPVSIPEPPAWSLHLLCFLAKLRGLFTSYAAPCRILQNYTIATLALYHLLSGRLGKRAPTYFQNLSSTAASPFFWGFLENPTRTRWHLKSSRNIVL